MTGTGGAKSDYLSAGRALEQNRDWSAAIDAYLKVGRRPVPNTQVTISCASLSAKSSLFRCVIERPRVSLAL